jgi:hypothetical protein
MYRLFALLIAMMHLPGCRTTASSNTQTKDTSIVATPADDQKSTAFCWAYAIVGHLEQRYYELTRAKNGGFRLNFSEEYLGLARIAEQLINGEEIQEGLKLSDSLALIERYGIVPEKIGDKNLFRAKFDFSVSEEINIEAQAWWQEKRLPEFSKIPPDEVFKILSKAAGLSIDQTAFLTAAIGYGQKSNATFKFANGTYTPQSWAKNRLNFSAKDYFVLTLPDSGRGQFNDKPYRDDYVRALNIIKKAMLYGYSVPISFNILKGGLEKNGILGCIEDGCWDTELSEPSASKPHANHAVLLVDYKSVDGNFGPTEQTKMHSEFAKNPESWVIKNSWGFNNNTSNDPNLLKRYPLPTFSIMTQDYFEVSHKLNPGRYEAIVPKKVCLKDANRQSICEPLITTDANLGLPSQADTDLSINAALIKSNENTTGVSRYPVVFREGLKEITKDDVSPSFKLVNPTAIERTNLEQVSLVRDTKITGLSGEEFYLCVKAEGKKEVGFVALFKAESLANNLPKSPSFILSEQNNWQFCIKTANESQSFYIVLQALNSGFETISQITTKVEIEP